MKKPRLNIEPKRLVVVVLFVVFSLLLMDLNGRLLELSNVTAQRDEIKQEVEAYQATERVLQTQIEYAESSAGVEDWARVDAHMARPGDAVIIPLPPEGATPVPTPVPTLEVKQVKNWQVWRALFWGN